MQGQSDDGMIRVLVDRGKHTDADLIGADTLIANVLAEAGLPAGEYTAKLGQARGGKHHTQGVKLCSERISFGVKLTCQPTDNATRREYRITIPTKLGEVDVWREKIAEVLASKRNPKNGKKPVEAVGADVSNTPEQVAPVEEVATEQPLPEIDAEMLIVFIDAIQCDDRTIENIRLVLQAEIPELRCLDHDTFETHVIRPLLVQGLLLVDSGVYRLTTRGKALLGPTKTETVVPSKTVSLSDQIVGLEAVVENASKAEKRLPEIDTEIVRLQASLKLLAEEKRNIEKELNRSDLAEAKRKLAQIRELLA